VKRSYSLSRDRKQEWERNVRRCSGADEGNPFLLYSFWSIFLHHSTNLNPQLDTTYFSPTFMIIQFKDSHASRTKKTQITVKKMEA